YSSRTARGACSSCLPGAPGREGRRPGPPGSAGKTTPRRPARSGHSGCSCFARPPREPPAELVADRENPAKLSHHKRTANAPILLDATLLAADAGPGLQPLPRRDALVGGREAIDLPAALRRVVRIEAGDRVDHRDAVAQIFTHHVEEPPVAPPADHLGAADDHDSA